MESVRIGGVEVSRLLLGSNPFSGFSHQGVERDREMVRHYTVARVKETLFDAERLGITGLVARTDQRVVRVLVEYRDEGGRLKWLAQTCPGVGVRFQVPLGGEFGMSPNRPAAAMRRTGLRGSPRRPDQRLSPKTPTSFSLARNGFDF